MGVVGRVDSLWRYPVKSMRGEELGTAFIGFAGIYGDRIFAFKSSGNPVGFPWVTGREQRAMLLYRPRFRHQTEVEEPPNLAEAEKIGPGVTPRYADPEKFAVDVSMCINPAAESGLVPSRDEAFRAGIAQLVEHQHQLPK